METSAILTDLRGPSRRAFSDLYTHYFGMVRYYVIRHNGSLADAEDLFQDTLLVVVEKLRRDDFQLTAALKTYIMAIARHLWLKRLRTAHRSVAFTAGLEPEAYEEITLAIEQETTYSDKIQTYLQRITTHCRSLIHAMFFRDKAIEVIQAEFGYTTKHSAINQKHKCVEQLRKAREKGERQCAY